VELVVVSEIDRQRVERLLMEIEEALDVINSVLEKREDEFVSDVVLIYAVRYAIVEIVEAATLVGAHILEGRYGVSVETYSDVFEQLSRRGVISPNVSDGFRRLVGLRNLIVHRYWTVDDARIYKEAKGNGLRVIREFVNEVRKYVEKETK